MTAGRGIVHSERTGAEARRAGSRLDGLQLWVALPLANEEADPNFHLTRATGVEWTACLRAEGRVEVTA